MRSSNSLARQRGIALLMSLLIVAIVTVTAVSLAQEQAISIRRTANIEFRQNALLYNMGLEDYARVFLQNDAKDSQTDNLSENWAIGIPALPIDGGYLSGYMTDAQSLINLNTVSNEESEQRLTRLCNQLEVDTAFIPALKDWIDENLDLEDPDGAEDDYYTSLEQPYRTANRMLSDVSELLLIKGMTRENYELLKPYVVALPADTSLNINTIPPEIYETIDQHPDSAKFIDERETDPFTSLEDYQQRMKHTLPTTGFTVKTEYFIASGQVVLGEKATTVTSLIHRDSNGVTTVLKRRLGDFS